MEIVFQLSIENQAWIPGWGGHQSGIFRTPPPRLINPQKPGTKSSNGNVNITSTLFDLQPKRRSGPAHLHGLEHLLLHGLLPSNNSEQRKKRKTKENSGESSERISKPSLNRWMPHPLVRLLLQSLAGRHPMKTFTSHPRYSISSKRERGDPPITHPLFGVSISFMVPLRSKKPPEQKKEKKSKKNK